MKTNGHRSSRQILGELESLLTQPTEPTRDEVEAAHGAATIAIRNVNEQLTSAHQLIMAGRRAEAIEIAEGPPHVLDEIAVLDSQLIRDWEHWAGQFGMPRFAPLRTDLASLLNGAYTAENQLEHVLRRHRLLAIGRANLRQRIAVLSQLASADPSNPQWNKALVACQRRRLEQLAERATQGRKHKDLRCLQQIMAELCQTRWLTPVSKAQVDSVQKQIQQAQRRESTNEAIALSEHIQDAYAAGDKTRLEPLIGRWRTIAAQADSTALSEVLPQVQSVIDWFDQDARQQRETEAQSEALDRIRTIKSDSDANAIQSVIDSIALSGAEMPPELRDAYYEKVHQEKRARRWKTGLVSAAMASVFIAIASVATIAYRSYRRDAMLTKMLATIDEKLAGGELAMADQLLDAAPRDDERFAQHRTRLTDQQLAENRRVAEFHDSGSTLRGALDKARKVEEFDALRIRVRRFSDRAEKDQEFVAAKELIEYATARREARKNVFIGEATQLIKKIREELETLEPDDGNRTTLTAWSQQLLKNRTDRWLREESDLLSELEATSNAVMDRRDAIRRMADSKKSLGKITASVGNWDRWQSLAEDAGQMEESVRSKFLAIGDCGDEESDLWSAIEQWNEIALAWKLDLVLSPTLQQAEQIKSDLTKVQQTRLGDLPAAADFVAACQVAIPTAARSGRQLELIRGHFQSPEMSGIGAIKIVIDEQSPDHWHYFPSPGNSLSLVDDTLRVTHFTDLAMTKTSDSTVSIASVQVPADFAKFREDYVAGNRGLLAPHVPFCKSALRQLHGLEADLNRWDQVFVEMYRELFNIKQMDPLIRLFLADAILNIGSRGSWRLALAYSEHLKTIQDAEVSAEVNWIDPHDDEAATARNKATAILIKLREMSPVNPRDALANMKQTLVIDTTYVPIGWLDQKGGHWLVHTNDSREIGPLYVRFKVTGSNKTTQIGKIANGKVSLNSTSAAAMRVGRPVWVGMHASKPLETRPQ